ncbi:MULTISPECIES: acyl-CoA dehydrogenase family protein [unclassified Streptomyces]|uniref:acyl-CoA dehydrogenase family protein n=1 Tax=unclassified Streptomyces TaxID=2593676 RepID=UPI000B4FEF42|nr:MULTISPECIES: acyl-CoA dehydrogenase family protein [unclassified Streptomyces]MYX00216.1 acyl-CoA dehydrogenase [Streptomyces sp. SID8378]SNB87214.1 Acyl-CoA dehydrogenase [Streptomyces sp. PgraA7]
MRERPEVTPHYGAEHEDFRKMVRTFLEREAVPHHDRWEKEGIVDRELWRKAGAAGLLGMDAPTEYGGGGEPDFRYPAVFTEELIRARVTVPGFVAHNDVVASYLAARTTPEQRRRWLPGLCSGELVAAIAISEPDAGSNVADIRTTAVRDGDHYVLNGQKVFITNGENADLVLVAARTAPQRGGQGLSLFVVERGTAGFTRGNRLEKLGWNASDTCELFFDGCRVPAGNLVGKEHAGMAYLMTGLPRERLSIATVAVAACEQMLEDALDYARRRHAFGQAIGSFQHNRFQLATMDTEVTIARVFLDHCVTQINAGRLSAADAAKAKWWTTELQVEISNRALQLYGGYGYLRESPISREWANSRVQTIYGGTTEIMKEMIGRSLGL